MFNLGGNQVLHGVVVIIANHLIAQANTKIPEKLVDKFVDRAITWPLHYADLDSSSLRKSHLDASHGTSRASQFPSSRGGGKPIVPGMARRLVPSPGISPSPGSPRISPKPGSPLISSAVSSAASAIPPALGSSSFVTEQYHGFRFVAPDDMADRMRRGVYETTELKMIEQMEFSADDIVVELGGCLGVVAAATNRRLPASVRHIVVEANPRIIPLLQMNRDNNNCTFEVEHCIVSDTSDGSFTSYDKAVAGSAHRMDKIEDNPITHRVPVKPTSELPQHTSVLIMDIEGGEKEALQQILSTIHSIRIIMIEIHEFLMYKGFEKEVIDILTQHGFSEAKRDGIHFLFVRSRSSK